MFLHGGWMHLIGNMLYLWIFGNNVEDVMGHVRFVYFYVLCGILAALSHALIDPSSTIPMVGASGAISGILGAYLLLFPRAQVLVLIPLGIFTRIMYVPAGFVLGMWFVLQLLSGGLSLGRQGGGVAFFAHVGGFVAGLALIGLFKRPDVRFFAPRRHRSGWSSEW
jgi:membrane associated rhomboid family serine protease